MVHIRTVDTVEGFEALESEWRVLRGRSRLTSPFLTHGWLRTWWHEYADESDRLHVLCCYDDANAELIGVVPTYVERERWPLAVRRLRFIGDALGATGLDCLADTQLESQVIQAVIDELAAGSGVWDVLDFGCMSGQSALKAGLIERFTQMGIAVAVQICASCPTVELAEDWERHMATLSHGGRRRVRRRQRMIEALGDVQVELIDEAGALPDALDDALAMFAESMSRRHDRPYTVPDRYRRFLRSASDRLLAEGSLRLMFLTVNGERVAFWYEIRHGDTMLSYQTGMSERWAPHSPTLVLIAQALEAAINEGCTSFDFGPSELEYKFHFGATKVQEYERLRAYRPSPRALSARGRDAAVHGTKSAAKRLVPQSALDKLKRESSWRLLQRM